MDRQGLAPLRKTWKEASDAMAALVERETDEVEKADAVKAASAAVQSAQAEANAAAAHAPAADLDPVEDYLRRYPHAEVNRGLRDLDLQPGPAK